jgi:hypothetical protein
MAKGAGGPLPAAAGLRLRAEDAEDLAVISACLQDALVPVRDLAYDRDAATFMLAANRFRWERHGTGETRVTPFERTLCALAFEAVTAVVYRGFRRKEEERILSLLAIKSGRSDAASQSGVAIDLEFAGRATIRLSAAAIRCRVRDFGEPWPTAWRPGHALDEPL